MRHFSLSFFLFLAALRLPASATTPVLTQSVSPISGVPPLATVLSASCSASDPCVAYVWDFGDNTSASGASQTHTFLTAGSYDVVVVASDKNGNEASADQIVTVSEVAYPKAHTEANVLQAGRPPFTASTPANTVVRVLSPYGNRMVRTTDLTSDGLNDPETGWVTPGGGGAFGIWDNIPGTLIQMINNGGKYIKGFNPSTLQSWPNPPVKTLCAQDGAFSRNNPAVYYCLPTINTVTPLGTANGMTVYTLTFAAASDSLCGVPGQCFDPTTFTWKKVFDFSTCPLSSSAKYVWTTGLGVGLGDNYLTTAISWTGQQNTAHLFFVYKTATGTCWTLDTQGNGANPLIYDSATSYAPMLNTITGQPLNATWFIHSSWTTGAWSLVGQANCIGSDCGTNNDGPPLVRMSDRSGYVAAAYSHMSGHQAVGVSYLYSDNNPSMQQHPLTNPATSLVVGTRSCSPCEDNHFSASAMSDHDPLVGAIGSLATTTWTTPYHNEVYGMDTFAGGKIYRFSPTWSGGYPIAGFYAGNAITGVSQDRRRAMLTSDMECGLRDNCGSDVFILDLTGN